MNTLDKLREDWRLLATAWSAAQDIANRYDEGRKILLDEMTLRLTEGDEGMSVAKAERVARTSPEFKSYVRKMYDAQRVAQDARIAMQAADRVYYEQVGAEALSRTEMRLAGAGR